MLLHSVRELYKKHPLLHTFSRFLALLEEEKAEIEEEDHQNLSSNKEVPTHKPKIVDETHEAAKHHFAVHNSPLPLSVLTVYLFARGCILHEPYEGRYASGIDKVKKSNTNPKMRDKFRKGKTSIPIDNPLHKAEQELQGGWWLTEDAVVVNMNKKGGEEDVLTSQLKHKENSEGSASHEKSKSSENTKIQPAASPNASDYASTSSTVPSKSPVSPVSPLSELNDWQISIPHHVCVAENYYVWIPLDRAVQVLVSMLSFLEEEDALEVLRVVEKDACFLSPSGRLDAPGAHPTSD